MDEDVLTRRIGTVVRGKWTLERLIGIGGMAAVYVGLHKIGRRDAIKILHPDAAKSKEVCRRFEREAQVVNRFHHPGAVEIRDIDTTEDGAPFLVMELLSGESLLDQAQRLGAIPLPDLLRYAAEVLDVLAAAHSQGIVHRDIKPGNLFIEDNGKVKVLDFGLARLREAGDSVSAWTKAGTALGTTPYMPPEQARGLDIDGRADVFSVGATLFRLITGRRIHDADEAFDMLMKMSKEPAPPILSIKPDLPGDVALVIDRSLKFNRDQRYPTARSMFEDVTALREGQRPAHALGMLMLEEIQNEAVTIEDGRPRPTAAPAISVSFSPDTPEIDVLLSSSILFPSIDVNLVNETPFPSTERDPPAPEAVPEITHVSPGNEARPAPKKA